MPVLRKLAASKQERRLKQEWKKSAKVSFIKKITFRRDCIRRLLSPNFHFRSCFLPNRRFRFCCLSKSVLRSPFRAAGAASFWASGTNAGAKFPAAPKAASFGSVLSVLRSKLDSFRELKAAKNGQKEAGKGDLLCCFRQKLAFRSRGRKRAAWWPASRPLWLCNSLSSWTTASCGKQTSENSPRNRPSVV